MSIIGDIIRRSKKTSDIIKKEDEAVVYTEGYDKIATGKYKNFTYEIFSGNWPRISIKSELGISVFSGDSSCDLKDRNGDIKHFQRRTVFSGIVFSHYYNYKGDYILNKQPGHKYILQELEQDVKAFIDDILKHEKEYTDELMKMDYKSKK